LDIGITLGEIDYVAIELSPREALDLPNGYGFLPISDGLKT